MRRPIKIPKIFPLTSVYTDASFDVATKRGSCAYIVVSVQNEKQFLSGEGAIVNRGFDAGRFANVQEAELYAIYMYLRALREHAVQLAVPVSSIDNVIVYCDNKTVVESLNNGDINGKFNITLPFAREINEMLVEFKNIRYEWVKGHANIKWNEVAHNIARRELNNHILNSHP